MIMHPESPLSMNGSRDSPPSLNVLERTIHALPSTLLSVPLALSVTVLNSLTSPTVQPEVLPRLTTLHPLNLGVA